MQMGSISLIPAIITIMSCIWLEKLNTPSDWSFLTTIPICSRRHLEDCFPVEDGWRRPLRNFHLLKEVILVGPDQEAFDQTEPTLREKVRLFVEGEAE